jgi:hypothetical protein
MGKSCGRTPEPYAGFQRKSRGGLYRSGTFSLLARVVTSMKCLLLATAVLALAVLGCSPNELDDAMNVTPSAGATSNASDRDAALRIVESRFPALNDAIDAVESENADAHPECPSLGRDRMHAG